MGLIVSLSYIEQQKIVENENEIKNIKQQDEKNVDDSSYENIDKNTNRKKQLSTKSSCIEITLHYIKNLINSNK